MKPRRFILVVCLLLTSLLSGVRALTVVPGGGPDDTVFVSSPAMVEGRPAITFLTGAKSGPSSNSNKMKYVRAADPNGAVWGEPVTVASGTISYAQMMVVNGNPAIAYHESYMLKFVRATDTTGSAWGAPVVLLNAAEGEFSMEIVEGNPAVCFSDGYVKFLRALDPSGATWGNPVVADSLVSFKQASLKVVDGRPAIAFNLWNSLFYVRALDATGTQWDGTHIQLVQGGGAGSDLNTRIYPTLQVVNGRPAISYLDGVRASVLYVRAANAAGTAWGNPVRASTPGAASWFPSLAVVNGKPAVGYYGIDGTDLSFNARDLIYVEASDSNGSAWGPAVTVDSTGDTGLYPNLFIVNGSPALTYFDVTHGSLRYARAVTDGPGTLWPPDVRLEQPPGTLLTSGDTKDYGIVAVGTTSSLTFTLTNANAGAIPLTGVAVAIDGSDAAEFSLTTPPAASLAGGVSTSLTVQYAPVAPGLKTAVLHVTANAAGVPYSAHITLTADSTPHIVVERPAGTALTDGGSVSFPVPLPGTQTDLTFTVRNTGGADLHGLVLTLDGPDAAEFSIAAAPASAVPPGGSTTFTVRHVMGSAGGKTAALHLESNLPGSLNPFDLSLLVFSGQPDLSFQKAGGDSSHMPPLLQGDGRIVFGTITPGRLLSNGAVDSSFSPALNWGWIYGLALQKDGKILVGGMDYPPGGPVARRGLVRLLPDGSQDSTFATGLNDSTVGPIAIQPDGKIVASALFPDPNNESFYYQDLVRFSPDGSRDASFIAEPRFGTRSIALQPDGKILVAGQLFKTGAPPGDPMESVVRLNPDGSDDATFKSTIAGGAEALTLQSDGKILVGTEAGKVVRLLPSGATDPTLVFTVPNIDRIFSLALQADGKCLIAGSYYTAGDWSDPLLMRINPDGTQDPSFAPDIEGGEVYYVTLQADGKALISGNIAQVGGLPFSGMIRLENDVAPPATLTAHDGTTVRWLRGGTAPEVTDVTFDVKPGGAADWTRLGTAARIPGGWELSGLTLPVSGQIRAQAFAGGSIMESVASLQTPLAAWRVRFLHDPNAADDADPDHDGLTNFTEYAFGLDPMDRTSSALPEFKHDGTGFTATFTALEGRDGVIYGAEWSATMQPGTWTAIPDTGTGDVHQFSASGGEPRIFVRYQVRMR